MSSFEIRPARVDDPDEVARLYDICVRTSDSGQDATALFADPRLPGDIFVGPYLALAPELSWVLVSQDRPVGYVLGVADTEEYEERLEEVWWPALRDRVRGHHDGLLPADRLALDYIARPHRTPPEVASAYPAHLHIDLLPRAQGGGNGARLIHTLLDALRSSGVPGVHLGVGAGNVRAIGFYRHLGFEQVGERPGSLYLARRLAQEHQALDAPTPAARPRRSPADQHPSPADPIRPARPSGDEPR